jgi:hypothetical protein
MLIFIFFPKLIDLAKNNNFYFNIFSLKISSIYILINFLFYPNFIFFLN